MTLTDEITIQQIAFRLGCRAEAVRNGLQMPDYPPKLLAARRAAFVKQIREYDASSDGLWDGDPRTCEQKDLDEFTKEVNETRKSDYPY